MRTSRLVGIAVVVFCSLTLHADALRELLAGQVFPRRISWSDADHVLWFSDEHQTPATVGFYNPASGQVETFPAPCQGCTDGTARVYIEDIFGANDGAWMAWTRVGMDGSPLDGGMNSYLSWVSTEGEFTTFPVLIKDAFRRYEFGSIGTSHIVLRPDGAVLFTMNAIGHVGVLDPDSGEILDKALSSKFSEPAGAALAPNGSTIVAMAGVGKLAEITLGNVVKEYQVPKSGNLDAAPFDVATGPDGRVMFTDLRGRVGLFTNGSFLMAPLDSSCVPSAIEAGGSGEFFIGCGNSSNGSVGHVMIDSLFDAPKLQVTLQTSAFDTPFVTYPVNLAWTGQKTYASGFANEANVLIDRLFEEDAIARCGLDFHFATEYSALADWTIVGMLNNNIDIIYRLDVKPSGGTPPYTTRVLDPLPTGVTFEGGSIRGRPGKDVDGEYVLRFVVMDSSVPPCARAKTVIIEVSEGSVRRRVVRH